MENKNQRILDTTLKLINERGFQDTSISLVAKETGVAVGTIYHYFDSKEELISELYSSLKAKVGEALVEKESNIKSIKDRFF